MSHTKKLNCALFNTQQDCFVAGSDEGIRVFNTHPLVLLKALGREMFGNIKLCTILHRSNLLLFVVAGNNSKFPPNVVFVWDDRSQELVLEVTVKGGPILNVLVASSRLVVVQDNRVHVFTFPNPCTLIRSEDMRFNPSGLAAMSGDIHQDIQLLVYPGFKVGSIQLVNLKTLTSNASLAPCTIDAHLTEIVQIALNNEGTLVATGSTKGTVIRVFNTRTHGVLLECRRGADPCNLTCLQFSPCSNFLAVSSDKGTMHIFAIRETDDSSNRRSLIHQMSMQVGLGKGERRSCSQIALEPKVLSCGFLKGSGTSKSVVAICADGTYHRFSFDLAGHVKREGFDYIMQLADEQEFWTKAL